MSMDLRGWMPCACAVALAATVLTSWTPDECRAARKPRLPAAVPDSNTVALWSLDGDDPDVASDSGPLRMHALVTDGVRVVPGYQGEARSFDGSANAMLIVPWSEALDGWGRLTIEAWVRISDLDTRPAQTIVARWTGRPHGNVWLFGILGSSIAPSLQDAVGEAGEAIRHAGARRLVFVWVTEDGKVHADASEQVLAPGLWTHVAVTFDGRQARFYRDHRPESSAAEAEHAFDRASTDSKLFACKAPLTLGGYAESVLLDTQEFSYVAAPDAGFYGDLDDIRISDRVRTDLVRE